MEFFLRLLHLVSFATVGRSLPEAEAGHLEARNISLFHHRGFHNCMYATAYAIGSCLLTYGNVAIVLGGYLYIDGGEITTWNGGGSGLQTSNPQPEGNIVTLPGMLPQQDHLRYASSANRCRQLHILHRSYHVLDE